MAEGDMKVHIDKLPLKRVEAIDEGGLERFPSEIGADEKRLDLIRRIDFSWVVEKDSKKAKKKSSKEEAAAAAAAAAAPWPWQGLVESLQLAHQELSVVIDLINTVEANDAVTVAGMTRPKQLPNEVLSDNAVSVATKLQRLRYLGRYFRQSSKALEKQVTREARFYGSLIRLQHNWKVKRQRPSAPGNEGFTIDLHDSSLSDSTVLARPSLLSTVRVDHDSAGMLALKLPPKSSRFIHFGFVGEDTKCRTEKSHLRKMYRRVEQPSKETKIEPLSEEDVDESVKETQSILREIRQAIFEEQVFDLVNREAFYSSSGVNVTGMREDFLQLGIGQEASVYLCLGLSAEEDANQTVCSHGTCNGESGSKRSDSTEVMIMDEKQNTHKRDLMRLPNPRSFEIYLQSILHENIFLRAKERYSSAIKNQAAGQSIGDGLGLLGHFCTTIVHRVFSKKVLSKLESLVEGVPYLHLLSHPTWHSRTSSWSLNMKVPLSTVRYNKQAKHLDTQESEGEVGLQFHTKVVVNDEYISISGEGTPSIIGSFNGISMDMSSLNCYSCDITDLPVILLQQVATQVIHWLHDEALMVGMKASMDFLSLYLELGQGEKLGLLAHVDPEDVHGCISWWLVMDNGTTIGHKVHARLPSESERRRFIGHLSLESLYSVLMDLVSLSSSGTNC
uniref:Mediator of RNA polymerase II transcription subunit 17 n=1 Tax=Anthurium amnicola TaxID=1678845 RepID=A0A1D1YJS2_9ARAE